MIDDKKIEAVAEEYNEKVEKELSKRLKRKPTSAERYADTTSRQCAFNAGAKWAINEFLKNLWHPNTEEPDKSKSDIITLGFDNDAYIQFKEYILWNEESWRHSISRCQIIKWAYLSDILPKEGGKK